MDHAFTPSPGNFTSCAKCKYPPIAHSKEAVCESCPNVGTVDIWAGMLLCKDCIQKEKDVAAAHQSPEKQAERLRAHQETVRTITTNLGNQVPVLTLDGVIDRARAIDQTVKIRDDVFNANTVAHKEIKDAVLADTSIPADEKEFRYTFLLTERFDRFQEAILGYQDKINEAQIAQRVIQQELNAQANKLRADQREKLRLNNPTYQPAKVKDIKTTVPKVKTTSRPKYDNKEFIELAAKLQSEGYVGVEWSTMKTVSLQRDMTPQQTYEHIKKVMAAVVNK